jgi:hypothetical protein
MRRLFETGRIIDLFIVPYRQDLQTVKSQKSGVFRDREIELKSLSEKGLLHMGVVEAPLCNAIMSGSAHHPVCIVPSQQPGATRQPDVGERRSAAIQQVRRQREATPLLRQREHRPLGYPQG